jgi:hypothetical protein
MVASAVELERLKSDGVAPHLQLLHGGAGPYNPPAPE